ncbi:MAG: NADH-quinone oxidoreductase subunit L [Steroidobacteraceae bacterium]|nr:NADH-quinone oxidoreductase subunit L [Steroidobacteraceae bacterium]
MNPNVLLAIPLLPLIAAIIAGVFGRQVGRAGAHTVTIAGVAISCALSLYVLKQIYFDGAPTFDAPVYTWLVSDGINIQVGFLVDRLTALMMVVVTFVSLCVHVYTIGYMHDDPGYQRFFSYISLFTFSMLMLVMSNNFMQLFFGWEAVGVVSYLLIGFWYTRPSAIFANMKAFIVNRVGDFGFIVGIAAIVYFTNSLDYKEAFAAAPQLVSQNIVLSHTTSVAALTVICVGLFIGAMGKSAQVPLHVWLPDSMEGPTPISALIHAATMVTAGIFMVARMSPLFEHSETALTFVLVIGATTAFFMGLLGVVNNDIKRVVAYSTLSQLGYMTVALGVSAYSAAIFHLMTHAFFKALLFLAAGSVIIGMHHEQDMRKMGGLAKYMPITAITCWIGALALVGTPFLSGFYSKDVIIEAVGESHRAAATYAYWCVLLGVFVTSLYTFRMLFMTFHGPERFRHAHGHGHAEEQGTAGDPGPGGALAHAPAFATAGAHGHGSAHTSAHAAEVSHAPAHAVHSSGGHGAGAHAHEEHDRSAPHESPAVVTVPLIALAIPSLLIGGLTVSSVVFGDFFGDAIFVLERNDVLGELAHEFHGAIGFALHGFLSLPFWLALAGAATAWLFFLKKPSLANTTARTFGWLRTILVNKYFFDWINENIVAGATRLLGRSLWRGGDAAIIDGAMVNGTAAAMGRLGSLLRHVQSGYLYSYAFWMIIGLAVLLGWFLWR